LSSARGRRPDPRGRGSRCRPQACHRRRWSSPAPWCRHSRPSAARGSVSWSSARPEEAERSGSETLGVPFRPGSRHHRRPLRSRSRLEAGPRVPGGRGWTAQRCRPAPRVRRRPAARSDRAGSKPRTVPGCRRCWHPALRCRRRRPGGGTQAGATTRRWPRRRGSRGEQSPASSALLAPIPARYPSTLRAFPSKIGIPYPRPLAGRCPTVALPRSPHLLNVWAVCTPFARGVRSR
jgi:hypothetical protein